MSIWLPAFFDEAAPDGASWRSALWNAFVALAGQPLPLGNAGAAVRFDLAAAPAPESWCAAVRLAEPDGVLLVRFAEFPFRQMAGAELDAEDLAALPDDLRRALVEGMVALVRDAVPPGRWSGAALSSDGPLSGLEGAGAPDIEWLNVRIEGLAGGPVVFLAGCRRGLLLRLLDAEALPAGRRNGPLAERLTVAADMTLGAILLSAREWAALEPGDVVVLPEEAASRVAVRIGGVLFDFTDTGAGWSSSGPRALRRHEPQSFKADFRELPMDPHPADRDAGDAEPAAEETAPVPAVAAIPPVPIDALRLAVDFDLGRTMLPFATVAGWTAGSVVELHAPVLANGVAVTIRVNGDVVGQGDLVRIDERVGVRITRLFATS